MYNGHHWLQRRSRYTQVLGFGKLYHIFWLKTSEIRKTGVLRAFFKNFSTVYDVTRAWPFNIFQWNLNNGKFQTIIY